MKGHGAKFPRKQQQAIAALIQAPSIREAARAVGVSEATLFRWLQVPAFRATYREARRRVVEQAIARLQRASSEAVEVLRAIMTDPEKPSSARVTAARTVLDYALRAVELDNLAARIEALEGALELGSTSRQGSARPT